MSTETKPTAQTNLFPAFEGPDHQDLHTKGGECVCKPYHQVDERPDATVTHYRHRPLTDANKANRPAWIVEAEHEMWEGGDASSDV